MLGAGRLGGTLAQRLAADDHDVLVAARRRPEELQRQFADHPGVQAADRDELASAELIVLAFPWRNRLAALDGLTLDGVLVVDATNPFAEDFTVLDPGPRGSSGEVAALLPGARLVKAWNTVPAERFEDPVDLTLDVSARLGVPIAGDEAEAKDVVHDLTGELGHTAVDVGSLEEGHRLMQPLCPLFMVPATAAELRGRLAALREG